MPDMTQLANQMLGDYRIERLLGQSPLGSAYLAVEPVRGTRVMVTTFHLPESQATLEREQFRARFIREGGALTRLVHANIMPIYAFGEQPGYLYLVTAFVKEASLGQTLKKYTRLTSQQTLHVLRQLAAGLDYAHSQGIIHGMLSLANVVVNDDLEVGIAGFGLRTMLEIHGNNHSARPLAHLSSAHGAFLGSPEYIAPERVLGLACDTRVDIYALGVILFALLSGVQAFRATTPLDIALQRLQQPTPLVHEACPTVAEAFDLVIGRALERDPARRFQSAGELVIAFERVVKAQEAVQQVGAQPAHQSFSTAPLASASVVTPLSSDAQMTMPPTINWFDEQVTPSGRWQVAPPIGTEKMRALNSAPDAMSLASSPHRTEKIDAQNNLQAAETRAAPRRAPGASLSGIDPFAWWSSHASGRKQLPSTPSAPVRHVSLRMALPGLQARPRPDQQGRRRVVTLAIAGVAAAGALTVGSITFARLAQSMKQSPQLANAPANPPTSSVPSSNQAGNPKAPPARAPGHTGTVIGPTTMAANSAHVFRNPADGISSLLIHLSNGTFVACERTCTHQGVEVNYDPHSKMIICPAHGAVFDPRKNFNHVSGPGNGPLARIVIHVNGDGTVTTG